MKTKNTLIALLFIGFGFVVRAQEDTLNNYDDAVPHDDIRFGPWYNGDEILIPDFNPEFKFWIQDSLGLEDQQWKIKGGYLVEPFNDHDKKYKINEDGTLSDEALNYLYQLKSGFFMFIVECGSKDQKSTFTRVMVITTPKEKSL